MSSESVTIKLKKPEADILSHIRFTPLLCGFAADRAATDGEIIESLIYFGRIAIQRIPGELNHLVDVAKKYAPKKEWEQGSETQPFDEGEVVQEVGVSLSDFDRENIDAITRALQSSGIEEFADKSVLIRLCMEIVFDREGFDGTIKKKFLDSVFISNLYRLRPVIVLRVLNEASPQKSNIAESQTSILSKMKGENQAFDNFRNILYSKPVEPTEATVVVQRYGSGSPDPSKSGASRNAITITENDFTLDFHVARMRQYRSPVGNFDFETIVLGYAFHILSWTDGTYNIPYLARRLFSLTYPPPPPRVSAEIRRVRAGYQYQPTVESFTDYRESYSYSAWSLDTMLSDFYRACKVFE